MSVITSRSLRETHADGCREGSVEGPRRRGWMPRIKNKAEDLMCDPGHVSRAVVGEIPLAPCCRILSLDNQINCPGELACGSINMYDHTPVVIDKHPQRRHPAI